jgi:hypothetical protein
MQYHFVVGFDTESNGWWAEAEPESYFPDGNIWDRDRANSNEYGFLGWFMAEEGSMEERIDFALFRALQSSLRSIPIPTEV